MNIMYPMIFGSDFSNIYNKKMRNINLIWLAILTANFVKQVNSQCGNGKIETGQQCDFGTQTISQGCSNCSAIAGYRCATNSRGETKACCLLIKYKILSYQCVLKCGDGIIDEDEKCDDKNTLNNDGCSSACQIQTGYDCFNSSNLSKSVCCPSSTSSYDSNTQICVVLPSQSYSVRQFIKIPDQNAINLTIEVQTARLLLTSNQKILVNFPYQKIQIFPSQQSSVIKLKISYNTSLNDYDNMTMTINKKTFYLPTISDNNLALKYYSPAEYQIYSKFNILMPIFSYLVLFLLIVTFLFSSKLIAMQTLLIFQYTYGGLLMMRKIEAIMYPYKHLWFFDGYNLFIDDGVYVPPKIAVLEMHSNFFSNFNASIAMYLLPLLIGIILLITEKISKSFKIYRRLSRYRNSAMGEWQISALLICGQQLIFAYVLNIQYNPASSVGIIVGTLLIVYYGFNIWRFYDKRKEYIHGYGDFKHFATNYSEYFYVIAMIYRVSLSLILVLLSDSIISQSLSLVLTVFWTGFIFWKKPYRNRVIPLINSIVMVLISIFYLYQRNKADAPEINFATYIPIVLICLLGITCGFNSIYAAINFHKIIIKKKKQEDIHKQHDLSKSRNDDFKLQFQSQTVANVSSDQANQNTTQNLSNLIDVIRQQNEKDINERPTTALKDETLNNRQQNRESVLIMQSAEMISSISRKNNNTIEQLLQEQSNSQKMKS